MHHFKLWHFFLFHSALQNSQQQPQPLNNQQPSSSTTPQPGNPPNTINNTLHIPQEQTTEPAAPTPQAPEEAESVSEPAEGEWK